MKIKGTAQRLKITVKRCSMGHRDDRVLLIHSHQSDQIDFVSGKHLKLFFLFLFLFGELEVIIKAQVEMPGAAF